jgi:hypothetical protein
MAIGLGIILLLVGLVLVLDVVHYDVPYVADEQLGTLLVVLGVAAVVVSLIYSALVTRRSRVEPHHHRDEPPPQV